MSGQSAPSYSLVLPLVTAWFPRTSCYHSLTTLLRTWCRDSFAIFSPMSSYVSIITTGHATALTEDWKYRW